MRHTPPATRRAVTWLVVSVVFFLASTEGITRLGFDQVSRIQARTRAEWRAAVAPGDGRRPVVLIVGNSLLGAGIDPTALRRSVGTRIDVRRLVVEDTSFYDWYFGARRLFAEGARPDLLVLTLSESQLVSTRLRGDYSARYLFGSADIPAAALATGAGRNRMASLALAHASAFWGARVEIRKWLIDFVMPSARDLLAKLARPSGGGLSSGKLQDIAGVRLRLLGDLARSHGCQVWLLVPPRLGNAYATIAVESSDGDGGVPVVVPLRPGDVDVSAFEDGMHLNAKGMVLFTAALAARLEKFRL